MNAEGEGQEAERSVLVCFALKEEASPFRKITAEKCGVDILLTGIGRKNAGQSIREYLGSCGSRDNRTGTMTEAHLMSCKPGLVITSGFAGALSPDLKVGDVLFEVQSPKSGVQSQLLDAGAKPAKFFCADRVAVTVAEKKKLREETGADAVEMESAAIQAVCAGHGIPCITIRVISDTADDDLPLDFNALAGPDKSLDYGKLFLAIGKSPGKIGALMKLQRQTRFAAGQLAEVLAKVV